MACVRNSRKHVVVKRADNKCEKCGCEIRKNKAGFHNGSVHHRRPQRLGVDDSIYNLTWVCLRCHTNIHKDEGLAADGGWIVWTDPAVTPIQRHNGGWVLLVPDGSMEYLQENEALLLVEYSNGVEIEGNRCAQPH